MKSVLVFPALSQPALTHLADEIAFALKVGDVLALEGDLGAGKTTFARALIRSLAGQEGLEIPSPTFTLVQPYATPRFDVAHFDLYRLAAPEELHELGLDHALARGIAIIEWPEKASHLLPDERFTLRFEECEDESRRDVSILATPSLAARLSRFSAIHRFLEHEGWSGEHAQLSFLQGDASARRYARLRRSDGRKAILMDSPKQPDGPPVREGKPYSQIAHLAEDVRPFVAIAGALRARGFSAPEIFAHDLYAGLLLIEDLGDRVFGREVSLGADQMELWRRGVDTLVALRSHPPGPMPLPDGSFYTLPRMDHCTLQIEADLLLDWYWPALHGTAAPNHVRGEFERRWRNVFDRLDSLPRGWVLRDYHSPNLIALDERTPPHDVGIIDFQDGLSGAHAYDLVSLLQDARLDVPEEMEQALLHHYVAQMVQQDPRFDRSAFLFSYAAMGAQRNTKILGIFARLAKRDGKRQYLAHIPRLWGYLARTLAHPELQDLKAWYDLHFPHAARDKQLTV